MFQPNNLLDVQPGLYTVLASTTGPDTTRFVKHGNRSLRQQQPSGQWQHLLTDGLGSVRSVLDANHLPLDTVHYTPYGVGAPAESLHGFTGEPTDANGLVHLRARYYDPALGVFPSLDPVEFVNRYRYVNNNPINHSDPSGACHPAACAGLILSPVDGPVGDVTACTCLALLMALGVYNPEDLQEAIEELGEIEGIDVDIDSLEIPGIDWDALRRAYTQSDVSVNPDTGRRYPSQEPDPTRTGTEIPCITCYDARPSSTATPTVEPAPTAPSNQPTIVPTAVPTATCTPTLTPTITPTVTPTPDCNLYGNGGVYPAPIPTITESRLIRCRPEAALMLNTIRTNGPFRRDYGERCDPTCDDRTWRNDRTPLPPVAGSREYREYTVFTPGLVGRRGERRLLTVGAVSRTSSGYDSNGMYYTDDHYLTFFSVDERQ